MSPTENHRATVLVVDDEADVADVLALKVRERYDVRTAYGGEAALDSIDDDVDVVLLDRRMPDVHGDDVLVEIRERGYDCKVIMTTAVGADLNILEMDFDDYLSKPIDEETLLRAIDRQLESRRSNDPRLEEFFTIVSKIEVLEDEQTSAELANSEEYADLKRRARRLGEELDASHPDFDEIVATFRDINRSSS